MSCVVPLDPQQRYTLFAHFFHILRNITPLNAPIIPATLSPPTTNTKSEIFLPDFGDSPFLRNFVPQSFNDAFHLSEPISLVSVSGYKILSTLGTHATPPSPRRSGRVFFYHPYPTETGIIKHAFRGPIPPIYTKIHAPQPFHIPRILPIFATVK